MLSFCTSEIDSTPPPTAICMPSCMISLAAVAIAIIPDEHCRSIDIAATVSGSPARSALCRATFEPWLPCCSAAPRLGDRVPGQGLRLGVVERAAIGPADRGAGGGDDDGAAHGLLLGRFAELTRIDVSGPQFPRRRQSRNGSASGALPRRSSF